MEAKATTRYIHISPSKARLVIDQIRGKSVSEALTTLAAINRPIAEVVEKTLNSAVSNLAQKSYVNVGRLIVKAAYADEGPIWKRIRPRAKGSASRIRKRTSHITVIVSTREEA